MFAFRDDERGFVLPPIGTQQKRYTPEGPKIFRMEKRRKGIGAQEKKGKLPNFYVMLSRLKAYKVSRFINPMSVPTKSLEGKQIHQSYVWRVIVVLLVVPIEASEAYLDSRESYILKHAEATVPGVQLLYKLLSRQPSSRSL